MSIIYSTTTAAGSSGWMSDSQLTVVLDSNVRLDVKNKGTKGWHPSIVMRALKTAKLKPAELAELSVRLKKLSKMAFTAQETGQVGLYEILAAEIACIVKEQEAAAIGYGLRIERDTISKFVSKTRDKVIKFDKLEEYLERIVADVERRTAELSSTDASNYLAKMLEQEKAARKALEKTNKSLLKRLKEAGIKLLKT